MNGNIDLNLTKAKQSSPEEEITEPNDSETNDITLNESENDLMPEGGTVLIADGTQNPEPSPPPRPPRSRITTEVIV